MRGQEMHITIIDTGKGKTIRIQVDERMDCSIHSVFCQAGKLASHPQTESIEIDLGKTRFIQDSGLAMLLMLRKQSNRLKDRIELINCHPDIRARLFESRLAGCLHIA
jgi:anti-anti-sigma regulatory factor